MLNIIIFILNLMLYTITTKTLVEKRCKNVSPDPLYFDFTAQMFYLPHYTHTHIPTHQKIPRVAWS